MGFFFLVLALVTFILVACGAKIIGLSGLELAALGACFTVAAMICGAIPAAAWPWSKAP